MSTKTKSISELVQEYLTNNYVNVSNKLLPLHVEDIVLKAGYRQVPEDCVMVPKEEYDRFLRMENVLERHSAVSTEEAELETKDLNKKYAEAIAKDYLNKNTELLGNIMTVYDRLKEAMLVRDISFGSEPAEEDVEIVTWWQVAKQFKELFNIGDYEDE